MDIILNFVAASWSVFGAMAPYLLLGFVVAGGVVYGTTNLGVCFAADVEDGSVRWISAYDVIELPPARLHQAETRGVVTPPRREQGGDDGLSAVHPANGGRQHRRHLRPARALPRGGAAGGCIRHGHLRRWSGAGL